MASAALRHFPLLMAFSIREISKRPWEMVDGSWLQGG
jgi:hypothetical protein